METKELKQQYDDMTTTRDMLNVIANMDNEQKLRQINALKEVNKISGLDMRQELFLLHLERD